MSARRIPLLATLALAAACGGSNTNQVRGSIRGQSIEVSDGLLLPPQPFGNGSIVSVVALESAVDACNLMQSASINNTRIVTLALAIERPNGLLAPAATAGTYQIGGPTFLSPGMKLAGVRFGIIGACGGGGTVDATSGFVEVDHAIVSSDGTIRHLDGAFEAVFDNGEKLSGNFQVSVCPGARLAFDFCS